MLTLITDKTIVRGRDDKICWLLIKILIVVALRRHALIIIYITIPCNQHLLDEKWKKLKIFVLFKKKMKRNKSTRFQFCFPFTLLELYPFGQSRSTHNKRSTKCEGKLVNRRKIAACTESKCICFYSYCGCVLCAHIYQSPQRNSILRWKSAKRFSKLSREITPALNINMWII